MRFKSLMNNLNVMNAALLAILVLVAGHEFPSFFHVQAKYVLPAPAKSVGTEDKTDEAKPLPSAEYSIIAEQNVFHPERKIPVLKAAAPPLPVPEFVLYGTLIAGDISLAYMEDLKGANSTGARRQKSLKKGETISGFTLKEIETDKVVMLRGEEKLEVRVTDKARTKHTDTIVSTQSSPQSAPVRPASGSAVRQPASQPASPAQTPSSEEARKRREVQRAMRSRVQGHNPQQILPQ